MRGSLIGLRQRYAKEQRVTLRVSHICEIPATHVKTYTPFLHDFLLKRSPFWGKTLPIATFFYSTFFESGYDSIR